MQKLIDESLYHKNISELQGRIEYLYLIERLKKTNLPEDCDVVLSSNGKPVIVWRRADGREIYFASIVDPLKEAKRFVDSLDLKRRLEVNIIGIGMGYHIDKLLDVNALDRINVIGLNLQWFKLLLHVRSIEAWVKDDRVNLLIDLTDVDLLNGLNIKMFTDRVLSRPLVSEFYPITTHFPSKTKHIMGLIRDSILNARVCTVTNISVSQQVMRNSLLNFPYLLKTPGMELWYDRFRGKPVFCISAGPSLRDSLDYIHDYQDRAIVVAVDTAVPVLQRHDITPDIVVGLDFSLQNKKHYLAMDLDKLSNSILLAAVDIHEDIIPLWRGPKVVVHSSHMFASFVHRKLGLFKGITTSHMAFLFSIFSGADPIILFGLDLSYPNLDYSHIDGVANRTNLSLIKEKGIEILAKRSGKNVKYVWARRLPSVDGGEVITEDIYVGFLRDFERIIKVCPNTIIDTKTAGAKIQGTLLLPMDKLTSLYCKEDLTDVKRSLASLITYCDLLFDRASFEDFWNRYFEEINQLKQVVRQVFEDIESLTLDRRNDADFDEELLAQINELVESVFDKKYFSVMQLAQQFSGAVMVLIRKFLTINQGHISRRERVDVILAFLEAIEKAVLDIEELFETARVKYCEEGIL